MTRVVAKCGRRMADRTEIDPAIYRPIAKSKWSGLKGTHPPGRRRHRLARYYSPLHSIHSSQPESRQLLDYPPEVALAQHTAGMSTPTPSGRATPPVPQGAGNPIGTPVVAPTRSSTGKDGASSNLGTFGVSTFASYIAIQRD